MDRLLVALATPFTESGAIDYKGCVNLIESCLAQGVDGFVVAGTTGEASTLTLAEKEELLRFVLSIVNHRGSVWMSCGTNNTATTLEAAQMAACYPVDGIMLITPYYNRPSQRGLLTHFKTVADQVDLPIMLYNVPKRTGVDLRSETVLTLLESCKNIVALKQASADFKDTEKILANSSCRVFCGDDGLLMEGLRIGMDGIVSVVGHLEAALIRHILDQAELGIEDIQSDEKLKKLTRACFHVSSPSDLKYLLAKRGLCQETVRLPLVRLSTEEKKQIDQLIERI